jgi:hypothetical protein
MEKFREPVVNASGRFINPYEVKPEYFEISVIAQSLSRICRFWSQTREFYSVAQHCLTMESLYDDLELKRWALAHEVFEGLTGMDIPSPYKPKVYREAETVALNMFADIHGLTKPTPKTIKIDDNRMMITEALVLMPSENSDYWLSKGKPFDLSVIGRPMDMKESEIAFLAKWHELFDRK